MVTFIFYTSRNATLVFSLPMFTYCGVTVIFRDLEALFQNTEGIFTALVGLLVTGKLTLTNQSSPLRE